jgi:cysteine desulfurase/selenocysteine lyase
VTAITNAASRFGYASEVMAEFSDYISGLEMMVPAAKGKQCRYVNLDNAASTPPFKAVLQTINDFSPLYGSVHRGSGFKSRLSTSAYEEARDIVGRFVGAKPEDHVVIFGKNTTEAINKVSYRLGLRKKDIVLISHLEHHSNDLPWRAKATVKRIGLTAKGGIDRADFVTLIERYSGRIKLVAISGASNVTGHLPDIYWFARQAHEAGAQILVDCAQLIAHRPIRMGDLEDPEHLDYIAISGHKMYAPFGSGALIGRRDTFTRGEPEYRGGGTIQMVTQTHVDWALPPDSDEAGTPNVIGVVAMASAVQMLRQIGLSSIASHEAALTDYALYRLKQVRGLKLFGEGEPYRMTSRSGVIPFTINDLPVNLVAAILGFEWGIGVRSGCFCAQPYVASLLGIDRAGQNLSRYNLLHHRRDLMPGLVRISFGLYNTQDDVDRLIEGLEAITNGEYGSYGVDKRTGIYSPRGSAESYQSFFKIDGTRRNFGKKTSPNPSPTKTIPKKNSLAKINK